MQYNNTPSEDVEQAQLFAWAAYASGKYPELALMHHIPNGGKRGKAEAARFKLQGVKAGVPDIFLPCARGGCHGLYIELKRVKGGVYRRRRRSLSRLCVCRVTRLRSALVWSRRERLYSSIWRDKQT